MAEIFGDGKKAEYPWQMEFPEWSPTASMTEAERRADHARHMFEWERRNREEDGWRADPRLFWYERRGFFRFSDGTFALSRERVNWPALKGRGFFREYGM